MTHHPLPWTHTLSMDAWSHWKPLAPHDHNYRQMSSLPHHTAGSWSQDKAMSLTLAALGPEPGRVAQLPIFLHPNAALHIPERRRGLGVPSPHLYPPHCILHTGQAEAHSGSEMCSCIFVPFAHDVVFENSPFLEQIPYTRHSEGLTLISWALIPA